MLWAIYILIGFLLFAAYDYFWPMSK
jgi:hypothetical protein